MTNTLLLRSTICVALILSVGVEAVRAEVTSSTNSSQLIAQVSRPLRIRSFTVNPVSELPPGTELIFTLQGTPNSTATFSIGDAAQNVPMEEVEFGVYEGRYIVQSGVPIRANAVVKGTLQHGYQTISMVLEQPLVNEVVTNASFDGDSGIQSLFVERFTLTPGTKVVPGVPLNFTLTGTPGGRAAFSIKGVGYNFPMREVKSGVYQGQYIVRQEDKLPESEEMVIASLQANNQLIQTALDQPLFVKPQTGDRVVLVTSDQPLPINASFSTGSEMATSQLPIEILSPQDNSQVDGTITVRGRSFPSTSLNLTVQAITSMAGTAGVNRNILSQAIKTDSQGNFGFAFNPAIADSGTRYEINLSTTNEEQPIQRTLVIFHQ